MVDELKTVYADVDEAMLVEAIALRKNGSDDVPWGTTFKAELGRRLASAGKSLSKRDRRVLGFIQTNQHAYCAEPAQLSTKDLADLRPGLARG